MTEMRKELVQYYIMSILLLKLTVTLWANDKLTCTVSDFFPKVNSKSMSWLNEKSHFPAESKTLLLTKDYPGVTKGFCWRIGKYINIDYCPSIKYVEENLLLNKIAKKEDTAFLRYNKGGFDIMIVQTINDFFLFIKGAENKSNISANLITKFIRSKIIEKYYIKTRETDNINLSVSYVYDRKSNELFFRLYEYNNSICFKIPKILPTEAESCHSPDKYRWFEDCQNGAPYIPLISFDLSKCYEEKDCC